jgi:hypothetical protein
MLYTSTKTLLGNILQSLEEAGEIAWDDHVESGKECLYEMFQMMGRGCTPATEEPVRKNLNTAIPHVKSMLGAIRRRDRAKAVEHGKAAFAAM